MVQERVKRPAGIMLTGREIKRMQAMLKEAELSIAAVKYYLALKASATRMKPDGGVALKAALDKGGTPCGRALANVVGGPPCVDDYDEAT
jgi:hypothetical protein